ncbi:MAG: glycosyl transferase [Cellulomonas sp. 73-145]|uniref:bifunctional glycosyltransferase family 2/GtrA family protein n=1 Tax=Cellulomonas sp. 73-145 TaxID=1895739 RepID=UPI000927D201|nr:bifunctional glycosyltransferase family 2/GtrA family protein [Cellulomonas sp. 73-145]OJV60137.1 MAG: glycosyl transferase [Cellulomonas sp. 73-145]
MDTTSLDQPAVAPAPDQVPRTPLAPVLDLVIPVHDEEKDLERAVRATRRYLDEHFPYPARVTIADNASTDGTWAIALRLAEELPGVRLLHLEAKGRGRALRTAWTASDAAVLAYMDVDLSTDLSALLPLVAPLISGHSHLAIGTRLSRSSRVLRGPRREVISRCYNVLLHGTLAARFSDAQCGFKAIRADAARQLLPLVSDTGWFFDTELLVVAEKAGLRIHEVPVDWVDDPDSRVDVVATARGDLAGIARLARELVSGRLPVEEIRAHLTLASDAAFAADDTAADEGTAALSGGARPGNGAVRRDRRLLGQLVRFAAVGVASTLAYALLYLVLAPLFGAQAANVLALLITAVANTAANRTFTFGVRGPARAVRHQGQGLIVFALAWALTSGSLTGLHLLVPGAGRTAELVVLTVANLVATVLRFVLLRGWVFHAATPAHVPAVLAAPASAPVPVTEGILR